MEREYYRRRDTRDHHDLDERQESENIVKTYPSISYATECNVPIVAFDKLDGSNIRAEWTSKKGWHKIGTRNRLLDAMDPVFGKVPVILENGIGPSLGRTLSKLGHDRVMCFFEFHGPGSFAGMHKANEEQILTLIDVAPFKQGIMMPDKFLEQFGHLNIPKVLWFGVVDDEFIVKVRESMLPEMTFEGVVCKGTNNKKTKMPIMFKQKSKAWLDKLKIHCGDNKDLFNVLK